jgi:tRNA modification GTPase
LSFITQQELLDRLRTNRQRLSTLDTDLEERGLSGKPFRVVLAGLPNAGKSSLFNTLLGTDVALVSPEAGTTRDYLVRRVSWDGVELELVDTAGAEEPSGDAIAAEAQAARQAQLAEAELIVWCSCEMNPQARRLAWGLGGRVLEVRTKGDLAAGAGLVTSAVTGQGLAELRAALVQSARAQRRGGMGPSVARCRAHVRAAREHLERASDIVEHHHGPEFLALELRLALDEVGEMVGAICTDELLDRIFSQFCIGK